jgi:hypothetical protein
MRIIVMLNYAVTGSVGQSHGKGVRDYFRQLNIALRVCALSLTAWPLHWHSKSIRVNNPWSFTVNAQSLCVTG